MPSSPLLVRVAALALAIAASAPATAQAADPLAGLAPEKRALLSDPAMLARFGLTPDKLQVALAGRSPADVDAYATALMAVVADAKFKPGSDMGEIPLNPQARGYNGSTTLRPKFLDKVQRTDGPFSLKRYMFQKGGIPTFADAPVAIRTADLIAGKIEVAFVGVPLDMSSGWRDAKHAPQALRAMDGLVGTDADGGANPALTLRIADFGDLSVDNMSSERTVDHVRLMVGDMAKAGVIPFIVGGDHTLMYPDMAAMVDAYGAGKVALVQFDAHAEAETDGDHLISDGQTLTRLIDQNFVRAAHVTQVGVRGRDLDAATAARLRDAGVRMHSVSAIATRGWKDVADDLIAGLKRGPENVFVSFDMSVLDPGAVAAVGRPVPGGLTMREAIPMVRRLCSETKVVGFDLLDAAPILDPTYVSTMSANYILHACLSGIALRKNAASASR